MPDNILTTISRLREARRKRAALQERFSVVATAADKLPNPLLARPQPTDEPLSEDAEKDFLKRNKVDRRQIVSYLDDNQLGEVLGLGQAYSMYTGEPMPDKPYGDLTRERSDPDRYLQPAQLARIDRLAFELGITKPTTESLSFWERVVRNVQLPLLPGLTARNFGPTSRFLFGDDSVPDPTVNPRGGVLHGMLLDPQDQVDYLKRNGVAGLFSDAWTGIIQEPSAAQRTAMIASIHTLLGGSNELATNIGKRIDAGEQPSVAAYNAYRETDLPPYVKGTAQELFDPTNMLVFGLVARTGLRGLKAATEIPAVLARVTKGAAVELSEADLLRNKAIRTLLNIEKVPIEAKLTSKRNVAAAQRLFSELDEKAGVADDWYASMKLVQEPPSIADELPRIQRGTWLRSVPLEDVAKADAAPLLADEVAAAAVWPIKRAVKLGDPSIVETSPVRQLWIARSTALSNWDNAKRVGSSLVRLLQPQMQLNADGFIGGGVKVRRGTRKLMGYPVSLHLGSFMETKAEDLDKVYEGLTDAQRLFHAINRRLLDDAWAIKVKYNLLPPDEIAKGIEYYPRFEDNLSVYRQLERAAVKRDVGLGTKQRFQFGRQHEYVVDALRAGRKLLANPALVWEEHMNQVARAVTERQLETAFKSEGLLLGSKDIEHELKSTHLLRDAVERHIGKPSERTLTTLREVGDTEINRILAMGDDEIRDGLKGYADTLRADMGLLSDALHETRTTGIPLRAGGPLLRGETAADEATAQAILRAIREQQARGALREQLVDIPRIVGSAADFVRTVSTNLDFSAPGIQGLPLLFLRPNLWAEATARHFEAFFIPSARDRFVAENLSVIQDMTGHGVQFGTSEFTAAMSQRFLGGTWKAGDRKIFKPIEAASAGVSATLTPFARAFDTFGDTARVLLWKTMRPLAKTEAELDDIGDMVNHMTGMFNSARLGISSTQQRLESFLLFSPRYNRAGLALLKDLFQGGIRRKAMVAYQSTPGDLLSWKPGAFTYFVLQAPALYYISATALGQEVKLDPRPVRAGGDGAEFMTYEVGGSRVGLGSWWITFFRLLGTLFADTIQNPDGFASWESVKDVSYDLYRFGRGKLGPGPATIEDIRTGSTFIGERVEGSNFANYVYKAAKIESARAMPFLLQDVFEGPPDASALDRLKRVPGSVAGMRVQAESVYSRRDTEEARLVTGTYGDASPDDIRAGTLDLPIEQQGLYALKQLYQVDSEWQHLTKLIEDDNLRRGSDDEILLQDFFAETERVEAEYDHARNGLFAEFRRKGEGKILIRALSDLGKTVSARFDALRAAPRFKEMLSALDERKQKDLAKRMKDGKIFAGDVAYELYKTNILGQDDVPVANGGFLLPNYELDWDAREAAMNDIVQTVAKLDPRYAADEFTQYVDLRRKARTPDQVVLDPLVQDLEQARTKLEPYWEIPKAVFGNEPDWPIIKEFLAANDLQAEERLRAAVDKGHVRRLRQGRWEGRADVIKRAIAKEKEAWRKRNPEGDALLADYYGDTPLTPQALAIYMERRKTRAAGA